MAVLIDGKSQAQALCEGLVPQIEGLILRGTRPCLRVILIGENPASQIYVRNKKKRAMELGIDGEVICLPACTAQQEAVALVQSLNADMRVHGILMQLPLPAHMDARQVIGSILPEKDVDGFHVQNMGKLFAGYPGVIPCTPRGIMALIDSTGVTLAGAHAVVVGRSMIVGKPLSMLLQQRDATVSMCHSKTKNIKEICRQADILVSAVGQRDLIRGDMVKPGAVVIDVGMNRTEEGKLCGDVCFLEAERVAGFITPVPGGVGPMTIAMLMRNTVDAARAAEGMVSS